MPLRVKCPAGHKLIVPDDRAGRTLRCPRCGEEVVVPGEEARVAEARDSKAREGEAPAEPPESGQGTEDRGQEAPALESPAVEATSIACEVQAHAAKSDEADQRLERPFDFLTSVEPPRATPVAARQPKVSAQLHADAGRTLAVYQLAAALVAAAVVSVVPAVWDMVEYAKSAELDAPPVARWALVLFFLAVVQLAYAVYLFQLPDWSSVWVVTVFLLVQAAGYAGVLGIVLISDQSGLLVGQQGLQLADKLAGGQAALWCLCMVSVATILALFAGRMSLAWQRAQRVLRLAGY